MGNTCTPKIKKQEVEYSNEEIKDIITKDKQIKLQAQQNLFDSIERVLKKTIVKQKSKNKRNGYIYVDYNTHYWTGSEIQEIIHTKMEELAKEFNLTYTIQFAGCLCYNWKTHAFLINFNW